MAEAELPAQPDAPDANVNQLTEVADAPKETPENEAEPSPAPDDTGEKPKKGNWASRRIDELTRDKYQLQRALEALVVEKGEPRKKEPEKAPEPMKTLADFSWDEGKFQEYVNTSLVKLSRSEAVAAAKEELSRDRERQVAAERTLEHAGREEKFSETVPDYHEVTRNGDLTITETMAETIQASESGPAIAYHLGKNPRLAERISKLPALQQAREIGRIEAKIEKPAAPKVSSAPPPAPKIEATENTTTPRPDTPEGEQLSDAAWLKARMKQVSRRS